MTENVKLSGRRQKFLTALLTEKSIGAAARAAGYSERQAYRVLRNPDFRAALSEAQSEALSLVTAKLAEASASALNVLAQVMNAPFESAATRVAAAKAILTFALGAPDGKRQTTVTVDGGVPQFIEVVLGADSPSVE